MLLITIMRCIDDSPCEVYTASHVALEVVGEAQKWHPTTKSISVPLPHLRHQLTQHQENMEAQLGTYRDNPTTHGSTPTTQIRQTLLAKPPAFPLHQERNSTMWVATCEVLIRFANAPMPARGNPFKQQCSSVKPGGHRERWQVLVCCLTCGGSSLRLRRVQQRILPVRLHLRIFHLSVTAAPAITLGCIQSSSGCAFLSLRLALGCASLPQGILLLCLKQKSTQEFVLCDSMCKP